MKFGGYVVKFAGNVVMFGGYVVMFRVDVEKFNGYIVNFARRCEVRGICCDVPRIR